MQQLLRLLGFINPLRPLKALFAKVGLLRILQFVHLLLASLFLIFTLFGTWAKRDEGEGALSANGGTGYGIVALVLAVALVVLALLRIAGRRRILPGLGVEQLTVMLGIAAWMVMIAFMVGWLVTFEAGTGWAAVAAYFPASIIPQIGMLTLSVAEPDSAVGALPSGRRRVFSIAALVTGVGVALFPFLAWLTAGDIALSAMDGSAGNPRSGPRFGFILLIAGLVVIGAALMRLRPRGLAEAGANALHGHGLITAGLVAVLLPVATWISIVRFPGGGLSAGIGLWLGLLAGLAMIVIGWVENRSRGAVGA